MNEREIIRKELLNILRGLFGRKEEEEIPPRVTSSIKKDFENLVSSLHGVLSTMGSISFNLLTIRNIFKLKGLRVTLVDKLIQQLKSKYNELVEMYRVLSPNSNYPRLASVGNDEVSLADFYTYYGLCENYAKYRLPECFGEVKESAEKITRAMEEAVSGGKKEIDVIAPLKVVNIIKQLAQPTWEEWVTQELLPQLEEVRVQFLSS